MGNRQMKNVIIGLLPLLFLGCLSSKDYSDVPHLEFKGFSKSVMIQGSNQQDSVIMTLYFTDGDGDFGSSVNSAEPNIFIKDLRTNQTFREYKAPFVPEAGASNGISGTIKIKIFTTCCLYDPNSGIPPCEPTDIFPTNVLPLEVYIKDRAGNVSNAVRTTDIMLQCNK